MRKMLSCAMNHIKIMESLASLVPNYKFMTKVKDSHDVVTY